MDASLETLLEWLLPVYQQLAPRLAEAEALLQTNPDYVGGGAVGALVLLWGVIRARRAKVRPAPAPAEAEAEVAAPAAEIDQPPTEAPAASEAPAAPEAPEAPEAAEARMRQGLTKTRQGFMQRLNSLIFGAGLDEDLADELETLLVTSDIGVHTTEALMSELRGALSRKEIQDPAVVRQRLMDRVSAILKPPPPLDLSASPTVIMVIGVNGVGKTTTIGKLAARWQREGKRVVLGAADTFRAAAVEQLEVWGERAGAPVVRGPEGADPSSVAYDAVARAKREGADICICDTAGRLHTKVNLMAELKKLKRVMDKACPGAPHEVMLVLDATTGQNGIAQAKQFKEAVDLDSIALTKLDGTAKGGVVVAITNELDVPVRFVGIGEQVDDLRDFVPEAFVQALFADS